MAKVELHVLLVSSLRVILYESLCMIHLNEDCMNDIHHMIKFFCEGTPSLVDPTKSLTCVKQLQVESVFLEYLNKISKYRLMFFFQTLDVFFPEKNYEGLFNVILLTLQVKK